jgi:hypothetical protein
MGDVGNIVAAPAQANRTPEGRRPGIHTDRLCAVLPAFISSFLIISSLYHSYYDIAKKK